ncbi:MAG: TusE/DsrC/DsvC family sulfur relay protein [Gammaproteobacteria bacterium]|nr:TusE/DsrC/DsvC family sulfur relay protein [Gammaproteobacteria bacterium]MCF6362053.1 TusE/DsrC/DsvC family sulfur relay protein [Gammaproteobacteria bacterium]
MRQLVVNGNPVSLTANGRLANLADWNPDLAQTIAKDEGLVLTDAHWDIIKLMRDYYATYTIPPILKLLKREIARKFGPERATDEAINTLFPGGVTYQGSKISGIPVPMLDSELEQNHQVKKTETTSSTPHYRDSFEFQDRQIKVYPSGNLVNPEEWKEELAEQLAKKEGIELTGAHWVVLRYLRKFYFQYGITPMVKILMKHMREELGNEISDRDALYRLFPGGPSRQGSRIAGLPVPQGCIDD